MFYLICAKLYLRIMKGALNLNTSADRLQFSHLETRRMFEVWKGNNYFCCKGAVYVG